MSDDPLNRFAALFAEARRNPQIADATAMTLSTVAADGRPSARIVLMKGVDARGLVFYTNLQSRKATEIAARPDVACTFWYPPLEAQIRFEGRASLVSAEEADAYFASRPRGSQLGAWASDQSRPLASRAELEARLVEITDRYQGTNVPRPPHWGGYLVIPRRIEFWKGRPDRLHVRELYERDAADQPWRTSLLYP
jgi:pyridoxamine 5'-phosphate oxidase